MSRIPAPQWVALADPAKETEPLADRVNLIMESMPNPAATLVALQYEAVAVITRLAALVERSSHAALIDKAIATVERWNGAIEAARVLIRK